MLLAAAVGFLAGLVIWAGLLLSVAGGVDSVPTISSALRDMTKPMVNCKDLTSRNNLTDAEKILKAANCNDSTGNTSGAPTPPQ